MNKYSYNYMMAQKSSEKPFTAFLGALAIAGMIIILSFIGYILI